jgi:hypothetical protein
MDSCGLEVALRAVDPSGQAATNTMIDAANCRVGFTVFVLSHQVAEIERSQALPPASKCQYDEKREPD